MDLDQAAISHIVWKEKLLRYLDVPDSKLHAELTADDQCALGLWITSEKARHLNCPEFASLQQHHTHLHSIVHNILKGARLGLSIRTETLVAADTDFGKASAATLSAIANLKRVTRQSAPTNVADGSEPREQITSNSRAQLGSVRWHESYNLGVAEIDGQHQYFFCLLNTLQEAINTAGSEAVIEKVFNELLDFARYHFTEEEELMAKSEYPGLMKHRRDHGIFARQLVKHKTGFQLSDADQGLHLLDFVRTWLTKHFEQEDKRFAAYLRTCSRNERTVAFTR